MEILNVQQGSEAWHKARKDALTASKAPAMMGDGYKSRNIEMEIALGIREEDTSKLQGLFEEGHAAEAEARPVFEKDFDLSVSPLVGVTRIDDLKLLASFDGITMDNDLVWEHKFTGKEFDEIPALYYWQLEHQMLVSGSDMAVLTITSRKDGVIRHHEYKSQPARQQELIDGWHKWLEDLTSFERKDDEWLDLASDYKHIKDHIDTLTKEQKGVAARLQKLAGQRTAMGGGVRVSVSESWEQKQTPAAYIKEHEIELPVSTLDKPKLSYRITVK